MKRMLLLCVAALCGYVLSAQLLTWTPPFPKESDASQTLVITMDATKGNQGLLNFTGDVYVHIGVVTSTSNGGWAHVPFTWGSTTPAAKAVSLGNNKWQYTISGSLRSFFGLTDPNETIQKVSILFRSGDGSQAQRNADGSDMYIPVYTGNLAVRIDQPAKQPKYVPVAESQSWTVGSNFSITANGNKNSTIKLYHNSATALATASNVQTLTASSTVTAIGNQQIIAEANDGTTTTYDTLNVFVAPASSPTASLPAGVRDGINYEPGDTSVTLVLRAPGKNFALVTGEFNNWTPGSSSIMNKTPDGRFFWIRIYPLTPGREYAYQYIVDEIKIADPYTEKVLDPNFDQQISPATYPNLKPYPAGQTGIVSVLQTGEPAYNWSTASFTRPDKRGLVIYELLVRDFVAAHDWKTIRDSLNYLKNLGINAIEIMPFNEFEQDSSWGYNPSFYFAPDKFYGPKNSFKSFVDSCHKKGIAVIMDIALNHSFGQSPMVQLYWDGANNRPAANNPWFNPVPKHAFNVGYDMNHESLDTRYFVSRVVEHWLQQYRIDGFRFDLSKGFTQNATCDNTGNNCNVNAMGAYDASRVAIWKRYYDTIQSKSANAYAILEHFADVTEERELADYGMMLWGNLNYNYSQASMGYSTDWDFSQGIYTVRNFTKPHLVTYMESHDEERIVYKNINFGNSSGTYNIKDTATALKRMELSAAFLFTIPGPKMIWQFGELGYNYSINTCNDGSINNNCRLSTKPIRWDFLNDGRRKSVYNTYSKLIALRFHPWYRDAFITGTISKDLSSGFKWIRVSSGDSSYLVVIGNFDVTQQSGAITFPVQGNWFEYLNNTTYAATGSPQTITLQPGEFRVYVNRNVNNLSTTPVTSVPQAANSLEAKAYPNPALSTVMMDLQLPQGGKVTIELFNQLGQKMETLYNGFLTSGDHQLSLKKKTGAGGNYYVKISTGKGNKTILVNFQ
jgi:1,4-alpha-glucan branching enzyme